MKKRKHIMKTFFKIFWCTLYFGFILAEYVSMPTELFRRERA